MILHLENTETGYAMTVILPAGGGIKKAEAEKLSEELGIKDAKYKQIAYFCFAGHEKTDSEG